MLSIKWGLLKYLIRKTLPVTLVAAAVACVYVLAWPELFTSQDVGPVAFILGHCLVVMIALGHNGNGQYEFLQTRGFSRGQILGRMTLVAAGAIVLVWAVAAVLVWTPIRGLVQYPNPLFPIMAPNEHPAVWAWLGYYAIGFALTWVGSWLLALPTYNRGGVLLFVSCALAALFLIIGYSIVLPDRHSRRRTAAIVKSQITEPVPIYLKRSTCGPESPDPTGQLGLLLNQARMADYQVDDRWVTALATYNEAAAIALLDVAKAEPGMMDIFDTVATRRYGLDKATDTDSAWSVFLRICDGVDRNGRYIIPSIEARAIDLIGAKLNDEQLCDKAESLIKNAQWDPRTGRQTWRRFGYPLKIDSPVGYFPQANEAVETFYQGFDNIPASGFAVAHAVWVLHQSQRAQRLEGETLIQKRLGPALVRRGQYELGAHIGGRLVEDFLLRQPWREQRLNASAKTKHFGMGGRANLWLYLLAGLDSPVGEQFRKENVGLITNMAYEVFDLHHVAGLYMRDMKCLFMDPALAEKFWPTFRSGAVSLRKGDPITWQWEYLNRMRPAPGVQEYVDCWKQPQKHYLSIGRVFQSLPPLNADKRDAIMKGVFRRIEQIPYGPMKLDSAIVKVPIADQSEDSREIILAQLTGRYGRTHAQCVAASLKHTKPNSPLIGMLARQGDPSLRAMAVAPCRAHPTADHRAILDELAADPDETVRTKAQAALADLAELAKTDPMALANPPR